MKAPLWLALVGALLGLGCGKPCETTAQCGDGEACVAASCHAVTCETPVLLRDPRSGACVALSGCFLTADQRAWRSCGEDPCVSLSENACIDDRRCQPIYLDRSAPAPSDQPFPTERVACGGGGAPTEPGLAPGVNNGEAPKHRGTLDGIGCGVVRSRSFSGCRAVPQVKELPARACVELTAAECKARPDCSTFNGDIDIAVPVPDLPPGVNLPKDLGQCHARAVVSTDPAACAGSDAASCLLNPSCQPVGTSCFCPPGARCECDRGRILVCQPNDRLRRCTSNAECRSDERCDNDEACSEPRNFAPNAAGTPGGPTPTPGQSSCLGSCVPKGCAGMGENQCNASAGCDGGSYGTVCRPKPYCQGKPRPDGGPDGPDGPVTDPAAPGTGSECGCDNEFKGCAPAAPIGTVRAERSLLVRDPEIVDAPAFRIDQVLARLAPAGRGAEFVQRWFNGFTTTRTLPGGATAAARPGFAQFLSELATAGAANPAGLAQRFHTTALINRVDLAGPGDCGEARITYALNSAYTNGNARMTIIVELGVPDDGAACRTVAQRWAELSLIEDSAERLRRLTAIYDQLLTPARLNQIRTNEFQNRKGIEPWELREWKLGADGMLDLAPVKQTVPAGVAPSAELLAWVRGSRAELLAGKAVVPERFLAAVSTENGGRVRLPTDLKDVEKPLNEISCAGCHLTETRSPFVHIGERLGKRQGNTFVPAGRAVIDEFMQKELVQRAANLETILKTPAPMNARPAWRAAAPSRTH